MTEFMLIGVLFLKGVLRIHVVGAKELIKADVGLMKKGLSDPYAVVRSRSME